MISTQHFVPYKPREAAMATLKVQEIGAPTSINWYTYTPHVHIPGRL